MGTFDPVAALASILDQNQHREERGATPMNVEGNYTGGRCCTMRRSKRNVIGPSKRTWLRTMHYTDVFSGEQ